MTYDDYYDHCGSILDEDPKGHWHIGKGEWVKTDDGKLTCFVAVRFCRDGKYASQIMRIDPP